jgi:hypothetical protein
VSVAVTTQSVVSVGETRLLAGMGLGAGAARKEVMVVAVGAFRLTKPASGSVPVLTDQRSTPHCANILPGRTRRRKRATTVSGSIRAECLFIALLIFSCDKSTGKQAGTAVPLKVRDGGF